MKHTFITFILLSLCIFTYAQKKIAREYIEWSDIWIPGANKTDLPHVLLIIVTVSLLDFLSQRLRKHFI